MRINVQRMVRAVAEGCDPDYVLENPGRDLNHKYSVAEASMGGDDLDKLYGEDFTREGKVNTFQPIDTGSGIRIRNIEVKQAYRHHDSRNVNLPHMERSRIYVHSKGQLDALSGAADASFKAGKSPADALAGDDDEGPMQRMMAVRRPENNPHEAIRDLVLPHVFNHLGMTGSGKGGHPHAQWHCQAGCGGCPCSPGFILHKSSHPLATNHDIWVETD